VIRWLGSLGLLTAVYLMNLGSIAPWDVGFALVAGVVILFGFHRLLRVGEGPTRGSLLRRAVAFPGFVWAIARDVATGTVTVSRVTLGIDPLRSPGIVAVPIGDRSETGIAVSALASTLSPGEFLVDVDRPAGVMRFHVLDASDSNRVVEAHQRFYERHQRAVFP
jgi:multisubunit Na+/H+ antiporter MnhE subunit